MASNETCITLPPRPSPMVTVAGVDYVVDEHRGEFRDADDPRRAVGFDTDRGRELCETGEIAVCRRCRCASIVGGRDAPARPRCRNCGADLVAGDD